jgi:hypothetical protein
VLSAPERRVAFTLIFNFVDNKVNHKRNEYALICLPISIYPVRMKKMTPAEKRILRKFGSQGGTKTAAALTSEQRRERAQKAAQARWGKSKKSD